MAETTNLFGDPRLPRLFWRKVEIVDSGCWLWTGAMKPDGYGIYGLAPSQRGNPNRPSRYVHRRIYATLVGPVGKDQQVDHTCHDPKVCTDGDQCLHRRCLNPAHLEAVSGRVNVRRSGGPAAANLTKTHCPQGHPYDDTNTLLDGHKRRCRICRKEQMERGQRAYLARQRALRSA